MTVEEIGKTKCTGCALCSRLCVKNCITIQPDEEGFLFPNVDHEVCINCGVCYQQCPINQEQEINEKPMYFAAAISNKEELLNSSSGGLFIVMAKWILAQGGYVCGCVFDDNIKPTHICSNRYEDVCRMMGSKYVQSTIQSVYDEIREITDSGKPLLFTGTACQIAAVKRIVKKTDYLYLVDILCHGVPSPLFFSKYISFLEEKHKGKVKKVEFRNKKQLGWGSEHRTYYEIERNGVVKGYRPALPAYFCSFFWGINLRESCYNCKFARPERISDITIGDFWGYWSYYHRRFPEGISVASVNTDKGKYMWLQILPDLCISDEVPSEMAKGTNTNFYHPSARPKTRDHFYDGIIKSSYKSFIWRTYFDKSSRKKMIVSLYGRFFPQSIKKLFRHFKRHD